MCVYNQNLNDTRKPFEFPIPRCDNAIISIGADCDTIFIISLDARQGCHNVQVGNLITKSYPYLPQIGKSTASVSCPLAQQMHQDSTLPWCAFLKGNGNCFLLKLCTIFIPLATTQLNKTKLVSVSRTNIDDILLFCCNLDAILIYLECVCKVFLKYWVIFRLKKWEFLKTWV